MNYRLIVLTHGDDPACAEVTLDSFGEMVTPAPSELVIVRDGPGHSYVPGWAPNQWIGVQASEEPVGFCAATRYAWTRAAAAPDADYVFWLEHDFEFIRPVNLAELAAVLSSEPTVAQMALMRDAVNQTEKAAGGLYESRPGQYTSRAYYASGPDPGRGHPWLEHRAYLTTNPSLMRRSFMQHNPWPDHPAECEGRFGIDLVERGYSFGVWGHGEPWVRHIGERTGFGY